MLPAFSGQQKLNEMHKVRLTPAARRQLKDIWNYSLDAWGEEQADRYLMDIHEALQSLAANPGLGRSRSDIAPGYTCLAVNKHLVFYLIRDACLDVIGVLHERMDVAARLSQRPPGETP